MTATAARETRGDEVSHRLTPRRVTLCVILLAVTAIVIGISAHLGEPATVPVVVAQAAILAVLVGVAGVARQHLREFRLVNANLARKVTEAARLQRERDRCLFLSGDLFCVVSRDGAVEPLNPAWARVLGFTIEQVAQMPWLAFAHPWAPGTTVRDLIQNAQEGDVITFESLAPCAAGNRRWLSWSVRLFPEEGVAYAVARDIDEKKMAANLLEERCDELARSNAELEQFAYVASHDLQEPLRMVSNYTQLLAERYRGKLDEKADRFIHYAVEGATRMQALIKDLLALARVNFHGKEFQRVDLHEGLELAMGNLETAIAEAGAKVTMGPLPAVHGNPAYLTQLLQNLVANALKFRSERPLHIHVWTRQDDAFCTVGVRDNGIGIAPEHSSRIFGIFERLHSRSQYPGTGIGLALCRKIVQLHRGRIWVESEFGCGSTFYFTLPPADDASNC
jgi:PAS domain S-box-containing protein